MGLLSDPTIRDFAGVQRNFDSIARRIFVGNGSPEGNLPAPRGSVFMREDGGVGTSLYAKQSAASIKTGWLAVA